MAGDEIEIALAHALRSTHPHNTAHGPYDFVPTLFINAEEPDFISIPMHRLCTVRCEFSTENIRTGLEQHFTLTEYEDKNEFILHIAEQGVRAVGIAFYGSPKYSLAVLKEPVDNGNPDEVPPTRYALTLFDEVIRTVIDGGSGEQNILKIQYASDTGKVWSALESGDAQIVCFANPTPVETILTAISSGLPLPKGTADFYPHLPLGLILHTFLE